MKRSIMTTDGKLNVPAYLTDEEVNLAARIAKDHHAIRIYRGQKGTVMISRAAMYSGLRETFYLRPAKGKP